MKNLIIALMLAAPLAQAGQMPDKYLNYMDGYFRIYSDTCMVSWSIRTSSFMAQDSCKVSIKQIQKDAIATIEYSKKNGNADTVGEWLMGDRYK